MHIMFRLTLALFASPRCEIRADAEIRGLLYLFATLIDKFVYYLSSNPTASTEIPPLKDSDCGLALSDESLAPSTARLR